MEKLKKEAGVRAANMVENGMRVGLGTGSTAFYAIERLAERIAEEQLTIEAVSTSFSTTLLCRKLQLPLLDLSAVSSLDLAIDGADEIDPARHLIKGRGGAQLIEKIVAKLATRFVVIADESKRVSVLGEKMPIPVDVHPHALSGVVKQLSELGAVETTIRMGGAAKDGPVITDSGHLIVDCRFESISNPTELSQQLDQLPGVMGHGIFAGVCDTVLLATAAGVVEF